MKTSGLRVFDGAVAIITGGASGIGRAMGEELARRGGEVVLADRQFRLAQEVAEGIRAGGGKASAAELDVTDFEATNEFVQRIVREKQRLDYMFNNAGIGIGGPVRLYSLQDWYAVLDVNLRGVVHGVQAAYPIMLEQSFGHIVNTASMAGLIAGPNIVSYVTTKHAVVGLSKSLRIEAEAAGVRVSVLCPGVIRTPILEDGGMFGKSLEATSREAQREQFEKYRPMDPNRFAFKAIDAVARNKAIIIFPFNWRIVWWIERLSPSLGMHLARRRLQQLSRLGRTPAGKQHEQATAEES